MRPRNRSDSPVRPSLKSNIALLLLEATQLGIAISSSAEITPSTGTSSRSQTSRTRRSNSPLQSTGRPSCSSTTVCIYLEERPTNCSITSASERGHPSSVRICDSVRTARRSLSTSTPSQSKITRSKRDIQTYYEVGFVPFPGNTKGIVRVRTTLGQSCIDDSERDIEHLNG